MPADSTHQTAPAATAEDLRRAAILVHASVAGDADSIRAGREHAARLLSLASLLPALLAVADAAVEWGKRDGPHGPLEAAVRALREAESARPGNQPEDT